MLSSIFTHLSIILHHAGQRRRRRGGGGSTGEQGGFSIPPLHFLTLASRGQQLILKVPVWQSDLTSDWVTLNFSLCGTNRIKLTDRWCMALSQHILTKQTEEHQLTSCFSVIRLMISLWSMRVSSSTSSSSLPADSVDFCLLKQIHAVHGSLQYIQYG